MNNNTMQEYLEMDGGLILNIALFKKFSSIGDSSYAEICGGFIEGVYQWVQHNLDCIDDSENTKYCGYTARFNGGAIRRMYIEKWVMQIKPKDFKHAKNLFLKHLRTDEKYNNSAEANQSDFRYY